MNHILSARGLHKDFGGITAIDDVTLDVREKELICIIGPNGAGKSTLLNIFCGVIKPDAGDLIFAGEKVTRVPAYALARLGILRKFQIPTVFPEMSVRENLQVAVDAAGKALRTGDASHLLARLHLDSIAEAPAGVLAHGDRQRLELGLCLMCEPKLLLLDEPTAGLTSQETMEIALLVRELVTSMAIVVIEHDMSFVRRLNCRTCVMHQGRIIRDGRFGEIAADQLVRAIYLGRE